MTQDDGLIGSDPSSRPTPGRDGTMAKRQSRKNRNPLREIVETALVAILIFVTVRSVVLNFRVDGDSMLPTLRSGEMILVSRVSYGEFNLGDLVDWIPGVSDQHWFTLIDYGSPERGDVIVLTPPEPGTQKPHIKRVIGLPGDHIQVTDDHVVVNGIELDESYTGSFPSICNGRGSFEQCDVIVPDGHVFVMGDHRDDSSDSRYFGTVPEDRVIGKAVLVYWPLSQFGPIDHPGYWELNP